MQRIGIKGPENAKGLKVPACTDLLRMQAETNLKALALEKNEFKFVKALSALVARLPRFAMEEDINETELCMRFVDPFLTGLSDHPDNGVYLRWTNKTTLEAKQNDGCTDRRPDMCITKSCGVKWDTNCGYGEAKPAARGGDHYLLCMDLVRVTVLPKTPWTNSAWMAFWEYRSWAEL
jgi:hypothetical protein